MDPIDDLEWSDYYPAMSHVQPLKFGFDLSCSWMLICYQ